MIAVNSMMLILAIVETLVAIVASVYCCSACCCGVQAQHVRLLSYMLTSLHLAMAGADINCIMFQMVLPAHVQYVSSGQRIIILTSTQQGSLTLISLA